MTIDEPLVGEGILPSFIMVDQSPVPPTVKALVLAPTTTTITAAKGK